MTESGAILVPIDFEAASQEALNTAKSLASRLGVRVVLLHVYTIPVFVYPGFEPIAAPGLPEELESAAKQAIEQLANASGKLDYIVRAGDPATEILRVIGEISPSMVVMGTHGRRGVAHFLLGSVAEKVIRASSIPVLTVHEKAAS